MVHEGIICERSEFFRRAMNGNWVEASDRIVKLPEDCASIFEVYMNLIYTGVIPLPTGKDYGTNTLVRLYVLGEKLQDVSAKNSVITSIINVLKQQLLDLSLCITIAASSIQVIYAGTPEGSPLRRLAVDSWSDPSWMEVLPKYSFPNAFLADLAIAAVKKCKIPSEYRSLLLSDGAKYMKKAKIEKGDA